MYRSVETKSVDEKLALCLQVSSAVLYRILTSMIVSTATFLDFREQRTIFCLRDCCSLCVERGEEKVERDERCREGW
jgi:hypothetical protein